MEREAFYYHFEQHEDAERLVVADDTSTLQALGDRPVRYLPQGDDVVVANAFRTFTCRASALPGSVRLKDYDYARPTFRAAFNASLPDHEGRALGEPDARRASG